MENNCLYFWYNREVKILAFAIGSTYEQALEKAQKFVIGSQLTGNNWQNLEITDPYIAEQFLELVGAKATAVRVSKFQQPMVLPQDKRIQIFQNIMEIVNEIGKDITQEQIVEITYHCRMILKILAYENSDRSLKNILQMIIINNHC